MNRFKNKALSLIPKSLKTKVKSFTYSTEKFQETLANEEIYRLTKLPRYQPDETSLFGKQIKIVDSTSYLFIHEEIIEKEIYKFITKKSNPYIIDGGANIGISAIYFKKLYPQAKIIAFEPDPQVFEILKFNLNSFNLADIELIPKGLWSSDTILSFYSEGADAGRLSNDETNDSLISINTTRLSPFLSQKVDFLKLDIEGAEYEVLKESRGSLVNVENIFVEYHSFSSKEQHLSEILEILKASGFRVYISTPAVSNTNPFTEVKTYLGMDLQVNIFGIRCN